MELTKLLFLLKIYCHCHYYQRVIIITIADCYYHHHHHHHHHHHYEYIISLLSLLNLVPENYTPRCALRLKQMLVYPSFGSQNLSKDVPEEEIKYPTNTQSKNRSPDVLPGMFFGCFCCFCFRFVSFCFVSVVVASSSNNEKIWAAFTKSSREAAWSSRCCAGLVIRRPDLTASWICSR